MELRRGLSSIHVLQPLGTCAVYVLLYRVIRYLCPTNAGEADLQPWRLTQTSLTDQTNDGGDNVDGSEE